MIAMFLGEIGLCSGLVYALSTGEVVLIPTNFDLDYPGIIFKELKSFKYYADLNFFPIGGENMTWFKLAHV